MSVAPASAGLSDPAQHYTGAYTATGIKTVVAGVKIVVVSLRHLRSLYVGCAYNVVTPELIAELQAMEPQLVVKTASGGGSPQTSYFQCMAQE